MFYAIKSVDNKIVDRVEEDWNVVKNIVLGHSSIYKGFVRKEDAIEYINKTNIEASFTNAPKGNTKDLNGEKSLKAKFLFNRFKDDSNGFCISIYRTNKGERITCKGYCLPENKSLYYKFGGYYNLNKKNGYEFIVENFEEVIENTKEQIIAYLSSGVIKGVGPKKAEKIFREFGHDTMNVLDKNPERLRYVKGFSKTLAESVIQQLKDAKGSREITQFLIKYGISQKYAMVIYQEKKQDALAYIKKHPYELCRFSGISFETADIIGKDCGIADNNEERMLICLFHVLKENEIRGNTGMKWTEFAQAVQRKLGKNVSAKEISDFVGVQVKAKRLTMSRLEYKGQTKWFIFSSKTKKMEENTARHVLNILEDKTAIEIKDIEIEIKKCEKRYGVQLDALQKKAIKEALTGEPLFVLTGGPGTGKTMIVKMIADIYESMNSSIIFLAPTGRAARRMQETSKRPASTIHSYLNIRDEKATRSEEDEVKINNSLVEIDEFSMADAYTADILFGSLVAGNRVVIIGDPDQLPSVGAGAVLRDLLNCKRVKKVCLSRIYRQEKDEKIVENSNKINSGDGSIEEGVDFKIFEHSNMEDVKNVMIERYQEDVKKFGVENVMCLCPYKEHTAGTKEMNKTIQDIINPAAYGKAEVKVRDELFRVGDMVMHLKNEDDVSNGDIGRIVSIDNEANEMIVNINRHNILYDRDKMKRLTLSYATTVHKSQGSEADCVICCFTRYHKAMLYRNLPYVAFSRGRKLVEFVGEMEAIRQAAKTAVKNERITLFGKYLKYYTGEFVAA